VLALIVAAAGLGLSLSAAVVSAPITERLKVATWNLEWLIAPEDFNSLKNSCGDSNRVSRYASRQIPCDVAYGPQRSQRDFAALARYATALAADVVALQEVDGAAAAKLVFPGYRFCFSGRRAVQNTGFAIRPGLRYRCGKDLRSLSLNDTLRRGTELIVFPGESREVHLLSIHLKSGCANDSLKSRKEQCQQLSRQIPALEQWIDSQAARGNRFAVLGDFNRALINEPGKQTLWAELDDSDPPEADLHNPAQHVKFRNCTPGRGYRTYIDHIVLSRSLGMAVVPNSFERLTYSVTDARNSILSDHCPIAVTLNLVAAGS
jgi:endonuclease/exonuclease/phosphatase family metal-dependent hydrolase